MENAEEPSINWNDVNLQSSVSKKRNFDEVSNQSVEIGNTTFQNGKKQLKIDKIKSPAKIIRN